MSELLFELITPEGPKFSEEVYEVIIPTPQGYIAVLPHHVALVTMVVPGVLSIRRHAEDSDDNLEHVACAGGLAVIDAKRVRLLADSAERAADIDELRAKEALERAHAMKKTAADQATAAEAVGLLELNLARLKVAELKRRRRPK